MTQKEPKPEKLSLSPDASATPAAFAAPIANKDLSSEIEHTIERLADETVRSTRVFDDYYRCNWWVQDKSGPAWLRVGKIRTSKLLKVTLTANGLLIADTKDSQ